MGQTGNLSIAIYEKNLIKAVLASIEKHGGRECLSSAILTGSFGRGEATYAIDGYGRFFLKSDVEIALVFPNPSKKGIVEKLIRDVSVEFDEDINLMAIDEKRVRKAYNFNFSLRVPKYKTIFTYDLFNGSRTIWGRDFISSKKISPDDIDLYEAKRLVANRIGELAYLQNQTKDIEKMSYLRKQWKGKLMLAIASAWLVCEGEYVPSYHGQRTKITNRWADAECKLGRGFFEEYEKVFHFLRENGNAYEVPDIKLAMYVKQIDRYFKITRIGKPKVNSTSRIIKYFIRYIETDMRYGIIGFEDKILQALIYHFWNNSDEVTKDADVWHKVLY